MNSKTLKTRTAPIAALLTAAVLGLGTFASASTLSSIDGGSYDVTLASDSGALSGSLNTEASWQTIQVPLADIGGTVPTDLSLSTAGLPEGLSISLERVSQVGSTLVLNVDVNRSPSAAVTSGVADVTLMSGATALTSFQVPVTTLAVNASTD